MMIGDILYRLALRSEDAQKINRVLKPTYYLKRGNAGFCSGLTRMKIFLEGNPYVLRKTWYMIKNNLLTIMAVASPAVLLEGNPFIGYLLVTHESCSEGYT
jgi:hypothetical protein